MTPTEVKIAKWIERHKNRIKCACGCGDYIEPKRETYYHYKNCQRKFFILKHQVRGKHHGNWKGGVVKAKGYIWVRMPSHPRATPRGYVRRYHLVMEEKLGRPLKANELVHHIDGNKHNDRPENLTLVDRVVHGKIHNTGRGNPAYRHDVRDEDILRLKGEGYKRQEIADLLGCSIHLIAIRVRKLKSSDLFLEHARI